MKSELHSPEIIKNCALGKESISEHIDKWTFSDQKEQGYVYACMPCRGVQLWANDFYMKRIPAGRMEEYHYLKINYCTQGRCEVSLGGDRFVYLEKGILSLDSNMPEDAFVSPKGRYAGLEIIFNLEIIKESPVNAFLDCGIDILGIYEELKPLNGSYLATVSSKWADEAEEIIKLLKAGKGTLEDYRFRILHLLYLIKNGHTHALEKKYYLTKGQRFIATEAEEKICEDLSRHITVEALASEYGISPSSLKKYFEHVYGVPISRYVRGVRMERACELLENTQKSIGDIAAEVGYGNQGKFGEAFKTYTGKTPLEYRRLHYMERKKI